MRDMVIQSKKIFALLLATICYSLVSCTSEASTSEANNAKIDEPTTISDARITPEGDEVVLKWSFSDNWCLSTNRCYHYEITADGSISATYSGTDDDYTETYSSEMDKLVVQEWWKLADQVDFVALQERLPPQRTIDSGSITLEVPGKGTIKTGLEAEYDLSEPFLKSTQELMNFAQDATTP